MASALERVALHDHVCSISRNGAERIGLAAHFIRIGLARGERCICLLDEAEGNVEGALAALGLDLERLKASGALVFKPKHEVLRGGRFDLDPMLDFWRREAARSKSEGYSGTRGAAGPDWMLARPPGGERWVEYEARLNEALARADCSLFCEYSTDRYPPELLLSVLQAHPLVFYDGAVARNPYYTPVGDLVTGRSAEQAVERWLSNIADYGRGETELRRGLQKLKRKQLDLMQAHRRLTAQFAAMSGLHDQLRRADEKSSVLLNAIDDSFFSFTADFRFAHLNRHAARRMRLLGKDPAKLIGRSLWEELPEPPNAAALRRVMQDRVPTAVEVYDEPLKEWFEDRIYPSTDGGIGVFSRNITERKRTEEAVRRGEAYLEAGERMSHTGSWALNPSSGELFWSAEHFRIMGRDPETMKPDYELFMACVHPDDRARLRHLFETALRERRAFSSHYRIVRPDGAVRHLRGEAHPVLDASGSLVEYIGSIIDVTELRESEEAVRKAREELAHVNRVLTVAELTASIAHEVNQPLAAVVANANACERWLAAQPANQGEAAAALKRITRDANRASEVIGRIRALLTRRELHKSNVDLAGVIGEVVSFVEGEARHQGIALGAVVEPGLPPILADRVRIQQVLLNLLVNAMDVLAAAAGPRRLEVRASRDDSAVTVRVRDSGPGIDPRALERVFEPFFSTKSEGMGMGLAIARSIIDEHGGRIRAMNNADGPGATFLFTLPLYT